MTRQTPGENPIKAGDIVMLRGGGPRMTVSEVAFYNTKWMVDVAWFVEGDELKQHSFPSEALMHAVE